MTRPWSEAELRTLTVIADTFVPGDDAYRRATRIAEALGTAADPAQVARFRLVLGALESRLANAALGGGPHALSRMDRAARERSLLGWGTSSIAQRRSFFASVRKLSTFFAYGDPGDPAAPNPRLAAIGYQPDRPLPATSPPGIAPLDPAGAAPGDGPLTLEADVVIVGSGAGGGVVAAGLAAAGRSVVVLEAGPYVDEAAMPTDELDAFDRLYLDHGLAATWDGAINLLAGAAVGGGTLVNWMTTIAPPASLRESWRRDHGIDDLADGEAWTADVAVLEDELAVRPASFVPPKDQVILRGAAALGWEAAPIRRNSAGCDDCGSCPFGCRRGAKRSGIRAHLETAAVHGARIVPGVRVERVVIEAGRASGVIGSTVLADGGRREVRVHAPQVVVAAGALRTPGILTASGLDHPAIGRHLRVHPVGGVLLRMPTPIELWRGTMQGARSAEFIEGGAGHRGYVIESAPGHPGLLAQSIPWEGADAHAAMMADARRLGALIAVTRDGGEGRTSLTRAGRVRVDYRLDATGVATLRHAIASAARIGRAAGATDVMAAGTPPRWFRGAPGAGDERAFERFVADLATFDFAPNRGTVFSAHQMGTVRMGADPRDHPCDPAGRVRRSGGRRADGRSVIGGLYVADTSLFPTGLGVNPMLTVMALARRVTRTVLAEG